MLRDLPSPLSVTDLRKWSMRTLVISETETSYTCLPVSSHAISHTVTPTFYVNLIKLKWEITRTGGLPHLHENRSLNCVLEVVQCICIIISDQPLLFWLPFCSHFIIIIFLIKMRKPLFQRTSYWNEIL